MSINVTVSGNPVNINRGKMITSDPYSTKKELDKRRLLRLEQVRQQSKDLAEDVRNKVRREKKKQMGEIEKEGKEKMKSWQNRKLLELQNQYQDALDEIGVGHKEAEELGNESDILADEQLRNEELARNRGKWAETKLQVQKNEENYKKAMPIQHKKLVRDIENTRAALVSCMKKKCQKKAKKPKASADINITIPDDSDFEEQTSSECSSHHLPSIQEEESGDSEGFCESGECSDEKTSLETPSDMAPAEKMFINENYQSKVVHPKTDADRQKTKKCMRSTAQPSQDPQKNDSKKSYQEALDERRQLIEDFRNRPRDAPVDTRISDRIRRRQQMISEPDFCDEACKATPIPDIPENHRIREKIVSRSCFQIDEEPIKDPLELSDDCVCCKCHISSKQKNTGVQTELGEDNGPSKCTCGPNKECRQTQNFVNFSRVSSNEATRKRESQSSEKGYRTQSNEVIRKRESQSSEKGYRPQSSEVTRKRDSQSSEKVYRTQSNEGTRKRESQSSQKGYRTQPDELTRKRESQSSEKGYRPDELARKRESQSSDKGYRRSQSNELPRQRDSKASENGNRSDIVSFREVNGKIARSSSEIPSKPAVKIKEHKLPSIAEIQPSMATSDAYKVRRYDFPNRYEEEIPSTTNVEKISADSLEVIPNSGSEAEWHEKMKQRDREAQMRGKRALEKEKVQRDYEDMMKKLPILQRKEHIAQIGTDKPEYHMSEERLQQRERERQNRLENAYVQAIPDLRPQIVTIPKRKHDIPKTDEPFEILDGDDSRTLNLGKWDTETEPKKMFSSEEVQEIIKAFTIQKPEDRKTKLKQLLRSLKLQKEQLIKEIQSLPKDDSINALLSDLNSFSDSDENRKSSRRKKRDSDKDKEKSEKKRRRKDSDASNTSDDRMTTEKDRHKNKNGKIPSKKVKKSKTKVLQNTSTQTTPKVAKEKTPSVSTTSTETSSSELSNNVIICGKTHVPCDCNKENKRKSEEVCKIVIKLNENDSPKVEIVRRGVKDKGGICENADVQMDKSPKSPKSKDKRRPKSPEKGRIFPNESTKRAETKFPPAESDSFTELVSKEPSRQRQSGEDKKQTLSRKSNESWKEHLSKNSMSTTSTSYLSPPEFSKPNTTTGTEASKQSLFNLRKKPQQKNVDGSSPARGSLQGTVDKHSDTKVNVFNGIKRLLSMSKFSVEELAVSSSEVQTPSQSIIEMDTNNPMASLHNVIKLINVKTTELANELRLSADVTPLTPVPPNSEVTEYDYESKDPQDQSQHLPEKDTNGSSSSYTKEQIASQYTDVTDTCSKRIAHLAALIEELRQEKMRILQSPRVTQTQSEVYNYNQSLPCDRNVCDQGPCNLPRADNDQVTPGSDRDHSTRYLEFPPSGDKSKGTNSTASMDEEELNRRLLEIDMSLAEKLKKFGQQKDDRSGNSSGNRSDRSAQDLTVPPPIDHSLSVPRVDLLSTSPEENLSVVGSQDSLDQTSQSFVKRLKKLMNDSNETAQDKKTSKKKEKEKKLELSQGVKMKPESPVKFHTTEIDQMSNVPKTDDVPFVPLLVNIPILPILEPEPEGQVVESPLELERRHPPPSKGLITAKKFNGNISLVPHELSTIVEADSLVSTRISPNNSKTCACSRDTHMPPMPTPEEEKSVPTDQSPLVSEPKTTENLTSVSEDRSGSQKTTPDKSEKTLPCKFIHDTTTQSYRCFDSSESSKGLTCNEATCTSLASTISSFKKSTSSSSDMESIEAMLRSIGMDWAIPTLHKTQEALALTSTSSSGDLSEKSKRKDKGQRSVGSEVSLKDFLKKQVVGNIEKAISSSSLKSDASPASFIQECSEISAIQANSSAEKLRQRTSTPVLSSKSTSKSKDDQQQLFTGASDISSVRNTSCEAPCSRRQEKQSFHTLGSDQELSKVWDE